jgi:hypothetical protein
MKRAASVIGLSVVIGVLWANTQVVRSQEVRRESQATRETMRGIFTAFTAVYSQSLDLGYFSDPRNREDISASLGALTANTKALDDHGAGLDPSFGFVKRSLAADAEEASKRYREGQYLGSQFMLAKLMENCAACHSRLPANEAIDFSAGFLRNAEIEKLSPVDRVSIEIASRQFGRALATYEEILAAPAIPAEGLAMIGAFEGYLEICIEVRNNTERPIRTFENFVKRDDIPTDLKQQVGVWIGELKGLDLSPSPGKELANARGLIGDAAVLGQRPPDRSGLVRMVAANATLHRYLQSASSYDTGASEAYYLLAVTESHIARSSWINEIDYLLEQAVRSAPKTEYAKKALGVLEERSKNSPPAGAHQGRQAPAVNIGELRKLVEG